MPDINGIPYVESSDLVSAYPTVSQDLAQEVSDQLASKLAHVHTETISAIGSVSINSVFDSTYDTYKILIDGAASTTTASRLRWRVGGVDNSDSQYIVQLISADNTSISGSRATSTSFGFGTGTTAGYANEIEVWNIAKATATIAQANLINDATATPVTRNTWLGHNVSTATTV